MLHFSICIYKVPPAYFPFFTLSIYCPYSHWYPPRSCPLCILFVQGGFTLTLHTCIHHILVRLTTSITLCLLPCFPNIQQCTVHYIIIFIRRCIVFQLFFPSHFPQSPQTLTNTIVFFLLFLPHPIYICIYVYTRSYIYLCINLSYRSRFHIWGETCNLCPSELGLLCLTWCSPVLLIYLWTA
jgi:hypothetical protein